MNLIEDPWIPVKTINEERKFIAPWEVTSETTIIDVDAVRPDFQGAYYQFLIGLFQTLNFLENRKHRYEILKQPPGPDELKKRLSPLIPYFHLNGDGPRFMQDFFLEKSKTAEISSLLIDSPGKKTVEENKDFFVKRGRIESISLEACAIALFTFQTHAWAGGRGHFTSLRGGGPLTTLVALTKNPFFSQESEQNAEPTLWQQIIINLLDHKAFENLPGNPSLTEPQFKFPWMGPTRTSERGSNTEKTFATHAHPAQHYWGMPRRVQLDFKNVDSGICELLGIKSTTLIHEYHQTTYGTNYTSSWLHPLTPYRRGEDLNAIPFSVPKGGIGYRNWPGIAFASQEDRVSINPARIVQQRDELWRITNSLNIRAFGYDMDQDKARCWYDTLIPLYQLGEKEEERFSAETKVLIQAADQARFHIRSAVKEAWFLYPKEIKGDLSFVDKAFWKRTESEFKRLIFEIFQQIQSNGPGVKMDFIPFRKQWHQVLRDQGQLLFEQWGMAGVSEASDIGPIYRSLIQLRKKLNGQKLRINILDLQN